jgi:hypothetical protein
MHIILIIGMIRFDVKRISPAGRARCVPKQLKIAAIVAQELYMV